MSNFKLELSTLVLDEFGRVVLSDDLLSGIEDCASMLTAGGTNVDCIWTSNTSCTNAVCIRSTNGRCTNLAVCDVSINSITCGMIPREVPGE